MAGAGGGLADAVFRFCQQAFDPIAEDLAAADAESVRAETLERWSEIKPGLPYLEDPHHPMALSIFSCAATLAAYLPLRERGVGPHDFGPRVHEEMARIAPEGDATALTQELLDSAAASLDGAAPTEFVYEVRGTVGSPTFEMDVRSCAISKLFSKHDAIELVPYMCALDDVFSDRANAGLRRTGTIALGATHCDFRYDADGNSLRLVEQYPDRIRLV